MHQLHFDCPPISPPCPVCAPSLCELIDLRQIDDAFDYAALVSRATVGEFLAAPAPSPDAAPLAIQVAVEFFVPPASLDAFASELDRAMTRRSLGYAFARRTAQVSPARLVSIPPGTFHQWRSTFHVAPHRQHALRWSADRTLLDQVLAQARHGWREWAGTA
jgi:hypothetical protein